MLFLLLICSKYLSGNVLKLSLYGKGDELDMQSLLDYIYIHYCFPAPQINIIQHGSLDSIFKPKPGIGTIPGLDLGGWGWGLGLGLGLWIGWAYLWPKIYRYDKEKIVNLDFTLAKDSKPYRRLYYIFIFDKNITNNFVLQSAYNRFWSITSFIRDKNEVRISPWWLLDNDEFIIQPCRWKGLTVDGIGFSDSATSVPILRVTNSEKLCLYVPANSEIKTASYPSFDIRNSKWCPSIFLPNGGGCLGTRASWYRLFIFKIIRL